MSLHTPGFVHFVDFFIISYCVFILFCIQITKRQEIVSHDGATTPNTNWLGGKKRAKKSYYIGLSIETTPMKHHLAYETTFIRLLVLSLPCYCTSIERPHLDLS